MKDDNTSWSLTGVYGPQSDPDKVAFLDELKNLKGRSMDKWLLIGDFNLIYKAEDKSNDRIDRRLMRIFKETLDDLQMMELDLRGRRFTWSTEQDNPTFTRIDRFFTPDWHLLFPNANLQALSTMGSDHCPLFLTGDIMPQHYSGFRFESFLVTMPGFLETVQAAWDQLVNTQDAILRMHVKFLRTAKALKLWKRQNLDNLALRLAIANEVLLLLDTTQEQRLLTTEELQFQKYLKAKSVGLAAIQRAQRSRGLAANLAAQGGCLHTFVYAT
jgi:hypothetical protein